jgi:hypothetical protein
MGWLKKLFGKQETSTPAVPPGPVGAEGGEEMAQMLARLGVPLDMGDSAPEAAMLGAILKYNIYSIAKALQAGDLKLAISAAGDTIGGIEKRSADPRLAGVCYFLRARAWLQCDERGRAGADIEQARRLYPDNPLIENAYAAFSGTAPAPRFYAPSLQGAEEVRRLTLGSAFEGVLRRHPAPEQQSGSVKYVYTLAVHPKGGGDAVLYVASELNKMPPEQRTGSHFLGVFPGEGHLNLGASDDWADLGRFEARAVEVAQEHLARR